MISKGQIRGTRQLPKQSGRFTDRLIRDQVHHIASMNDEIDIATLLDECPETIQYLMKTTQIPGLFTISLVITATNMRVGEIYEFHCLSSFVLN